MIKDKRLPYVVKPLKSPLGYFRYFDCFEQKEGYLKGEVIEQSLPLDLEGEKIALYVNEDSAFSNAFVNNLITYADSVGKLFVYFFSSKESMGCKGVKKSFCNPRLCILKQLLIDRSTLFPSRVIVLGDALGLDDTDLFEETYWIVKKPVNDLQVKSSDMFSITGKTE